MKRLSISRRSSFPWPAHNPDLSSLDYWLWNQLEQEVFNKKPNNIPELREVVQETAANNCEAAVRRAEGNFRRIVNLFFRNKGRYFESGL